MLDMHSRQLGLVEPSLLNMSILLVGAGGIGSWTALGLAKMGCKNVRVIDHDKVEIENLGSQIYGIEDVGAYKSEALVERLSILTGTFLSYETRPYEDEVFSVKDSQGNIGGIVISAVDSMEVRKQLFEDCKGTNLTFIDGRMAANEINLYCVPMNEPETVEKYEKTLFLDSEARDIPCSQRAVMYNTMICGGLITDHVAHIANKQPIPFEIIVDLFNYSLMK